jgi:hypothetical protein
MTSKSQCVCSDTLEETRTHTEYEEKLLGKCLIAGLKKKQILGKYVVLIEGGSAVCYQQC